MSDDFNFEPIRGLPELPPSGETILWQGAPDWRRVARDVYHIDKVAIYFGLLLLWAPVSSAWSGAGFGEILAASWTGARWLVPFALAALGILGFLAWLTERTSVYTITSQRLVLRIGIALPMTFNIPFRCIGSATLRAHSDGTGDIPVSIMTSDRIAYLVLWPHARPWWISKPEPALRAVANASQVAEVLANALAGSTVQTSEQRVTNAKDIAARSTGSVGGKSRAEQVPQTIMLAS